MGQVMNNDRIERTRSILILILCALTVDVHANIPEPDNIIYGFSRMDAAYVTLEIDGQEIARYTIGDNPKADGKYILRVPIDSFAPQKTGTARPGDEGKIYVNGESEPTAILTIGEHGSIITLNLESGLNPNDIDDDGLPNSYEAQYPFLDVNNWQDASEDEDGDGLSNFQEYQLSSNPTVKDTDRDGLSDKFEFDNALDPNDGVCPTWACGGNGSWRHAISLLE